MRTRTLFVRRVSRGERLRHMTEFGIETHVSAPRRRSPFDIFAAADPRTLEILRRRHTARHPRRRGWLVRRALVVADLAGLAAAMVTVELIFGQGSGAANRLHPRARSRSSSSRRFRPGSCSRSSTASTTATRSAPTTRRSTTSSASSTSSRSAPGSVVAARRLTGARRCRDAPKLVVVLGRSRSRSSTARARVARALCRRSLSVRAEHDHRRRRRRRPAGRPQAPPAPRVRHQPRRLRRRRPEGAARRTSSTSRCSARPTSCRSSCEQLDVERVDRRVLERAARARRSSSSARCATLDVQIDIVPRLFEVVGPSVDDPHASRACRSSACRRRGSRRSSRLLKRAIDLVGASLVLVLTAPLFASSRWRIKRDSPGPVFFRQTRLGHEHARVHGAQVPDDEGRHRRRPRIASTSERR